MACVEPRFSFAAPRALAGRLVSVSPRSGVGQSVDVANRRQWGRNVAHAWRRGHQRDQGQRPTPSRSVFVHARPSLPLPNCRATHTHPSRGAQRDGGAESHWGGKKTVTAGREAEEKKRECQNQSRTQKKTERNNSLALHRDFERETQLSTPTSRTMSGAWALAKCVARVCVYKGA